MRKALAGLLATLAFALAVVGCEPPTSEPNVIHPTSTAPAPVPTATSEPVSMVDMLVATAVALTLEADDAHEQVAAAQLEYDQAWADVEGRPMQILEFNLRPAEKMYENAAFVLSYGDVETAREFDADAQRMEQAAYDQFFADPLVQHAEGVKEVLDNRKAWVVHWNTLLVPVLDALAQEDAMDLYRDAYLAATSE